MLKIPADKFARAVEALMVAATSATDQRGLKVRSATPSRLSREMATTAITLDSRDEQRIRAIALGAIVALVNGPAHVDDEHHFGTSIS